MDREHPWRSLVITLIVLGTAAWIETPEWQRQAIAAKVKHRARRTAAWMARRYGHRAMGHELAGHDETARAGYGMAYRFSLLRDRL